MLFNEFQFTVFVEQLRSGTDLNDVLRSAYLKFDLFKPANRKVEPQNCFSIFVIYAIPPKINEDVH